MDNKEHLPEEFLHSVNALAQKEIPANKSEEIWNHLEGTINSANLADFKGQNRLRSVAGPVAAAVAALIVVGVGIPAAHSMLTSRPSITSTNRVPLPPAILTPRQPLEVVTQHWRVVVSKVPNPTPDYELMVYYNGKTPIPLSSVVMQWGTNTMDVAKDMRPVPTQRLTKGEGVPSYTDLTFPNGLKDAPPVVMTWKQNGQLQHEALSFSRAKADIRLVNAYSYVGEDATWKVTYMYNTLVASDGFKQPEGEIYLVDKQGSFSTLWYTLTSSNGTVNLGWEGDVNHPQSTVEMGISSHNGQISQPYRITQPTAKITVQWSNTNTNSRPRTSDTITLRRQN